MAPSEPRIEERIEHQSRPPEEVIRELVDELERLLSQASFRKSWNGLVISTRWTKVKFWMNCLGSSEPVALARTERSNGGQHPGIHGARGIRRIDR